ncbi:MAG: pyruvate, phosphate dikinase [Candidatus Rariloculaceae bacterium]
MTKKSIYLFEEGNAELKDLLGGKGANLAEMTNIGLPVPPGFTITTQVCKDYYSEGKSLPTGLEDEIITALSHLEQKTGKKLGNTADPLLVSVRSGAKFSMPGMMDTILNLGLNDETIKGLIDTTGDERFAYDAYRRFIMMFSNVVMDVPKEEYEHLFTTLKKHLNVELDTDVDAPHLKHLCNEYKALTKDRIGQDFPQDVTEQLKTAIEAVFRSWNNKRAILYRKVEKISHDIGTAVNVQAMVFGNKGNSCGTGVAFTRNPATGVNTLYGEYLMNAQGEDVVAGVRTPLDIQELSKQQPKIYQQFTAMAHRLEAHYKEMQDIEFTIENGQLFLLQCRTGKRTKNAAIKIAVEMVNEGLITKEEAILNRITPAQLEQSMHPRFVEKPDEKIFVKGMNAGPGAATGKIVFDSQKAAEIQNVDPGAEIILVREETNPDDLAGMLASKGVLTSRGGRTSHAALVARQFGVPTICGCSELQIDSKKATVTANGITLREGDWISIDGSDGIVFTGKLKTEPATAIEEISALMEWADSFRKLKVRANADTPDQATEAIKLGAEGIGLCRTEHMFLGDRAPLVQRLILAEEETERSAALDELLPLQRQDFEGIFKAMGGRPTTIRLIDPPLHEFLPSETDLLAEVIRLECNEPESPKLPALQKMLRSVRAMHEANPMLGLRGCRLSFIFPGIVQMQVTAIISAACKVRKEGLGVEPEIMIPLVSHVNELKWVKERLEQTAQQVMQEEKIEVDYSFGTMIETPRAALTAGEIATEASFFSFGTNDLTQMIFGISRDDAGTFLRHYIDEGILPDDPTESIDQTGVGRLIELSIDDARKIKPELKLGICGEHGGDPRSIAFCHTVGMEYVSCSPKRVPIARLAAAQAALSSA